MDVILMDFFLALFSKKDRKHFQKLLFISVIPSVNVTTVLRKFCLITKTILTI